MLVKLTDCIDINEVYEYLYSDEAGAVNTFLGTVRNHSKGKTVIKLEFEAYEPMALKELNLIAERAKQQWPIYKVAIIHVVGSKQPGEAVVITGVSSAHREASFEACRFLIDELKKTVPIWKKEYYEDSSVWVNAHP
ncbi:molybdenum cofactor biosynthesis protein MoaE [Mucilaginibacter sp. RS28]|uniref:Molybdopterin synthase catalytic subunit n=1 Tax=Mucilaginibacter straminoryzae TaxID=2932774 RepID=A0A9X1X2J3_9SPHI|nr:molybdenum cofactor biosynthesis protein MoaE [Mucilaginibacter straminoryzae]MCJ8210052.1 molybdenum cofactor biosynthesis protein MoaE [Mucilaginibacter straminoryzae]